MENSNINNMGNTKEKEKEFVKMDHFDGLECICNNVPEEDGFLPCGKEGVVVEETVYHEHMHCERCGRIILLDELLVVGIKEVLCHTEFDKEMDCHLGIFRYGSSYEVLYMYNQEGEDWNMFGGSVGYSTATFKTLPECYEFIKKGLAGQKDNPDIWLDMVACDSKKEYKPKFPCPIEGGDNLHCELCTYSGEFKFNEVNGNCEAVQKVKV